MFNYIIDLFRRTEINLNPLSIKIYPYSLEGLNKNIYKLDFNKKPIHQAGVDFKFTKKHLKEYDEAFKFLKK